MKRRLVIVLILLWLVPVLACNAPVAPTADPHQAGRETLAARIFATLTPGQPASGATLAATEAAAPQYTPYYDLQPVTPVAPGPTLEGGAFRYTTQPGDTIDALARRFNVPVEQVFDPEKYPPERLLPAGLQLTIPDTLGNLPYGEELLPDNEIVNSPAAADFSVEDYVQSTGGFLSTYSEDVVEQNLPTQRLTGAQIIQRVANDTSTNPRLLLAFLEYRSHWVLGSPPANSDTRYPIGFYAGQYAGLYKEMVLASRQLTIGYYGWRSGKVLSLTFLDKSTRRIHPAVNAGTAALQYLFSTLYNPGDWQSALYGQGGFLDFYARNFGDPWGRAARVGPVLSDALSQPALELPFQPGASWSFTGGPHAAWGVGSPWGGLDFAPSAVEPGCTVTRFWATAAASGLVVRSGNGQVVLDLDGDGQEQTGWEILYLHMADQDRIPAGGYVQTNDRIGHPSCEGGYATGTHAHIARKYNGEWIGADGPVPFVLSGWQAVYGDQAYAGRLVKGEQVVTARPDGSHTTLITR